MRLPGDLNKGISSIAYNYLNLPQQMEIKSPVAEVNKHRHLPVGRSVLGEASRFVLIKSKAPALHQRRKG